MKKPVAFGKYYLLERINVGGMAEVFRAKAYGVEGFERLVAVKRILPNIAEDKEFIRMFIDEAKISVQLNHANIAQIFDLGVVDQSYYIALEHIHGRDLRSIFDRGRQLAEPMPVAQACFVVMKVCEGLDYAHNKRDASGRELHLVHRDVSPQNILVSFEGEVKVIDFGIAKAAGKGSKTQAGILKGKFGYMSPEQVRGLGIDRKSDIFSAGIVLYELLTGERLFVGESDFSTLEKVRNVEILPPSTYNRKIPDELERIVLKALAKDTDDRYQNAIDLHDELQAFVYTAGEFYSRKDLAAWMKRTFAKEIEEETAKLDAYRQLPPPTGEGGARPASNTRPPPAPSQPPPVRRTGAISASPPPRASGTLPPPSANAKAPAAGRSKGPGLSWDDDELETQIYDNPPEQSADTPTPATMDLSVGDQTVDLVTPAPARLPPTPDAGRPSRPSGQLPAQRRTGTAPPPAMAIAAAAGGDAEPTSLDTKTLLDMPPVSPDLSALSSTGRTWDAGGGLASGAVSAADAPTLSATPQAISARADALQPPVEVAAGSSRTASPYGDYDPDPRPRAASLPPHTGSLSGVRVVQAEEAVFGHPTGTYGAGLVAARQRSTRNLYLALGAGLVAVLVAIVIVIATGGEERGKPAAGVAQGGGDPSTGLKVYVEPRGVPTTWSLNGAAQAGALPAAITGLVPGPYTIAVQAPEGYVSTTRVVQVARGETQSITIALEPTGPAAPLAPVLARFESTPPGAQVSLLSDGGRQALGAAPVSFAIDRKRAYSVLFELDGHISVNRALALEPGQTELAVPVVLQPIAVAETPRPPMDRPPLDRPPVDRPGPVDRPPGDDPGPVDKPPVDKPPVDKPPVDKPPVDKPPVDKPVEPSGTGFLMLGAKPPCDIYVNGSALGKKTPSKLSLPAGKHSITLVNNQFGIREKFTVEIEAGETVKMSKDFSDKLE